MDIHVSTIGHSHHTNSSITFFVCLTAALAGLLFGLDIGVIAGALPFITETFTLSSAQQEWIVSTMMFGATIGAIISGWLSAQWGRKYSLMIGAILFVIGSLCAALSPTIEALVVARMILGLAVGIASYTAPLYLSEISPENIRGSMISMYQLMITIGILVAYLSDAFFSYHEAWRWMLGVITFPALLLLVGVYFLPRSPRWLASHGHDMKAKAVLKRLRNTSSEAQRELEEIHENLKATQSSGWTLFKQNSNFRRAVYLGILLQVMQQFTGMNVIMYYAPKIFGLAGFASTTQQVWGSVIVGLVNVLATFIAIAVVDHWGRKPTMIIGFTVMAIGMGLLGIMMWIGIDSIAAQYFTIVMLLMFIVGFAMSAGPLVWVLCSEIQPLKGRDFGITCSTTSNWIANMVVGATFLTMLGTLGSAYTFWVYAGLNILFILLTLALIPETKNLSLEQIERNLMSGKPLRHLGSKETLPLEEINRQSNLENLQHNLHYHKGK